jgi:hypothetical protein
MKYKCEQFKIHNQSKIFVYKTKQFRKIMYKKKHCGQEETINFVLDI